MSKKILLVDDDVSVHSIIEQVIDDMNNNKEKLGVKDDIVLTTCNAYNAVELLMTSEFDLILLDEELECQDGKICPGFDVLDESGTKTPFYLILSYRDDDGLDSLASGAVERGCLDFIVKPLVHDVLLKTLVIAMHRIDYFQKKNT